MKKGSKLSGKISNLTPGAPGPHAPGAGRPPDWLKEKCRNLVEKGGLIERLKSIANGELVDIRVTDDGGKILIPAPISAQVKAAEILMDRGWGKAPMAQEDRDSIEKGAGRMVLIFPETPT